MTITAFTVERYIAICHPLRAQVLSSPRRAVKVIIAIWLVAIMCALPYPLHARVYAYLDHPETNEKLAISVICNIALRWRNRMQIVFQMTTFLLFVFPMAVITVLYVLIGITLNKANIARQSSTDAGVNNVATTNANANSRKVVKMLGKYLSLPSPYLLYLCLSFCLSMSLFLLFVSVCLYVCLSFWLSVCLSVGRLVYSLCLFRPLSAYL